MLHKRRGATLAVGFVLTTALMLPTSGAANAVDVPDQVLAWNRHAYVELFVQKVPAQAPLVAIFNLGIVHAAVYDAANAIDGGFQPYLEAPNVPSGASVDAAAASAAYEVLKVLIPDRIAELDDYYAASLDAIDDVASAQSILDGEAVGRDAAAAILADRTGDGRGGSPFFTEGDGDPGEWVNLAGPLNIAGNNFKWVGDVEPFMIENAADFATPGPLALSSAKYAEEFNQVKKLGAATGSSRTADQTAMAQFWADHPIAMWTRMFQQIASNRELGTVRSARYFAMLYLTGSDALIACFQDKERNGFWRPTTAIHDAEFDGNPATTQDDGWTALLAVPPYPDHPSAHNCVSNSFVQTLRDFFGSDRMSFGTTRTSSPIGPITRTFRRFSEAIGEIRLARVYGGLHFMTPDAQGATLGRKVANYRQTHFFQPL
jgi:hypothetical protein